MKIRYAQIPLDSRPEPVLADFAPDARKLLCRRYNDCLTHAAALNWPSFGCGDCLVEEPMTKLEQQHDLEGLAGFLQALSFNER